MPDRFDFLEIGDSQPKPPPPASEAEVEASRAWQQTRLRAVEVIGEAGVGAGQFSLPTGITVDPWGSLYIADSNNHRIQRITNGGDVYVIGRAGTAAGEMWNPQAVTVAPSGEFIFVAEQGTNRVQCFSFTGQSRGIVQGFRNSQGQMQSFRNPQGLAFDMEGKLWIADTGNGRVLRMNIATGQFVGGFDSKAGFIRPLNLACDHQHNVYITDSVGANVIAFNYAGTRGVGIGDHRKLHTPTACATDSLGRVYITEAGENRLHVFDREGNSIVIFDKLSTRMGELKAPSGVAIGPQGEVYVSDTQNHRVVRLAWE